MPVRLSARPLEVPADRSFVQADRLGYLAFAAPCSEEQGERRQVAPGEMSDLAPSLISVFQFMRFGSLDGFDDPVIGELRGSRRLAKSFGRLRLEDVQDRLVAREERCPQMTDIGAELCRESCAFALSVDGAHGCIRLHQVARHQPPTVEQPSPEEIQETP